MSLAMFGVIIYTEENRQQQLSRQTQYVNLEDKGSKDNKEDKINSDGCEDSQSKFDRSNDNNINKTNMNMNMNTNMNIGIDDDLEYPSLISKTTQKVQILFVDDSDC